MVRLFIKDIMDDSHSNESAYTYFCCCPYFNLSNDLANIDGGQEIL